MVTIRGPLLSARASKGDINYEVCTVGENPHEGRLVLASDPHSGFSRRPQAPLCGCTEGCTHGSLSLPAGGFFGASTFSGG